MTERNTQQHTVFEHRWIDQRIVTTSFAAEETLTSDTVPVNVDAVLFWMVYDPEKAALEVQNYPQAVSWAAQTALRDIIGRTSLTDLLRGRERIEEELQKLAQPVEIAGQTGQLYDQAGENPGSGDKSRIVAAVLRREGVAWAAKVSMPQLGFGPKDIWGADRDQAIRIADRRAAAAAVLALDYLQ